MQAQGTLPHNNIEVRMQDERGIYYHPQPHNPKARVYVRRGAQEAIEFRLWQADHAEVWEKHQWIGADVIRNAAALYAASGRGEPGADPMRLYDAAVAKALLHEAGL